MPNFICARFGHKFEARYNIGEPTLGHVQYSRESDLAMLLEASKPRTYLHDICPRCGTVVKRP